MKKCFQRLLKDEIGSVFASEMLIMIVGVAVASGIVLKTVSNPLKILHESTTKNITKVSRGF